MRLSSMLPQTSLRLYYTGTNGTGSLTYREAIRKVTQPLLSSLLCKRSQTLVKSPSSRPELDLLFPQPFTSQVSPTQALHFHLWCLWRLYHRSRPRHPRLQGSQLQHRIQLRVPVPDTRARSPRAHPPPRRSSHSHRFARRQVILQSQRRNYPLPQRRQRSS